MSTLKNSEMDQLTSFLLYYVSLVILIGSMGIHSAASDENRQVYIVYMGSLPEGQYSPSSHHLSILQEVVEDSSPVNDILVRSYKRSFNGFAAKLTEREQQKIASMEGVVSVFPSKTLHPQTTRSWDFMGFSQTVKRNPGGETDVIIGVVDTGIWPELESFNDKGIGPVPKKWKGSCEGGANFTCNKKIIGARVYNKVSADSARDKIEGHGTSMASVAAGQEVKGVDFFGLARGNARGAVPSARIAVYKVCYNLPYECPEEAFLAALDDAIADGVDILIMALTYAASTDLSRDVVAIGAYHAMKKGILTTQAVSNNGPGAASVGSIAPWILSVAASTIDRKFTNKIILGDNTTFTNDAINTFEAEGPLVYGNVNVPRCPESAGRLCMLYCLDEKLVKGKILVCDNMGGYAEAYRAGAAGSISPSYVFLRDQPVPSAAYGSKNNEIDQAKAYLKSTTNPQAKILKSEEVKYAGAPIIPDFSARGPSPIIPDIIKPDISAPGVMILAGYPPILPPSGLPGDKRSVKYNIVSGTSIACAHAAGAAAYVKSFHPDWSPSSVKSALLTTARPMNSTSNPDGEFAFGAGHIDPVKAIDPGLVYEALEEDYVKFLCSMGYTTNRLRGITGDNSSCPTESKETPKNLNYPSLAAHVVESKPFNITFPRTVTNVGLANSTYKAKVSVDAKIKIEVVPDVLSFKSLKEKKSFAVTISGGGLPENSMVSASLIWSDGKYNVRSPIVLYTNQGPQNKVSN